MGGRNTAGNRKRARLAVDHGGAHQVGIPNAVTSAAIEGTAFDRVEESLSAPGEGGDGQQAPQASGASEAAAMGSS